MLPQKCKHNSQKDATIRSANKNNDSVRSTLNEVAHRFHPGPRPGRAGNKTTVLFTPPESKMTVTLRARLPVPNPRLFFSLVDLHCAARVVASVLAVPNPIPASDHAMLLSWQAGVAAARVNATPALNDIPSTAAAAAEGSEGLLMHVRVFVQLMHEVVWSKVGVVGAAPSVLEVSASAGLAAEAGVEGQCEVEGPSPLAYRNWWHTEV